MSFLVAADVADLAAEQASFLPHRATLARVVTVDRPGGGSAESRQVVRSAVPCRVVDVAGRRARVVDQDQLRAPPGRYRVTFAAGESLDDGTGAVVRRIVTTLGEGALARTLVLAVVQVDRPALATARVAWCDEIGDPTVPGAAAGAP